MTKEQFHEEELTILRRESISRNSWIIKFGTTIIFLLLGSIGGGVYMFVNHENRITKTETITQNFIDNSGSEFIARSVAAETEGRLSKRIDEKADKSSFDLILRELDDIKKQLNKK